MGKPHWHTQSSAAIIPQISTAFITCTVLLLASCSTQSLKPPAAVSQAFAARYPSTTATWKKQPYGYEGIFYRNGVEYEAEFAADGQWLETEHEVSAAEFSQAVIDRVKQEYPSYTITKHEIEQTPQGTFYEVEIEQADAEYELYFDSSVTPVRNANEDS
jgi:hypothetical protein